MSARERLPVPSAPVRFGVEASFIILVGVISAVLALSLLAIVIVMGLAWVVVVLVERAAKSTRPRRAPRHAVAPLALPVEHELPENPQPERESRAYSEPGRASRLGSAQEWNIWELERRAREHAGAEAVPEEWSAIFMYLREFAKSDGVLPPQFDSLVRESFPELTRVG